MNSGYWAPLCRHNSYNHSFIPLSVTFLNGPKWMYCVQWECGYGWHSDYFKINLTLFLNLGCNYLLVCICTLCVPCCLFRFCRSLCCAAFLRPSQIYPKWSTQFAGQFMIHERWVETETRMSWIHAANMNFLSLLSCLGRVIELPSMESVLDMSHWKEVSGQTQYLLEIFYFVWLGNASVFPL